MVNVTAVTHRAEMDGVAQSLTDLLAMAYAGHCTHRLVGKLLALRVC